MRPASTTITRRRVRRQGRITATSGMFCNLCTRASRASIHQDESRLVHRSTLLIFFASSQKKCLILGRLRTHNRCLLIRLHVFLRAKVFQGFRPAASGKFPYCEKRIYQGRTIHICGSVLTGSGTSLLLICKLPPALASGPCGQSKTRRCLRAESGFA